MKGDWIMNNTIQQSTEKSLADFRKLLVFDKYKECVYYDMICPIKP